MTSKCRQEKRKVWSYEKEESVEIKEEERKEEAVCDIDHGAKEK